jgi:hypothetical protein
MIEEYVVNRLLLFARHSPTLQIVWLVCDEETYSYVGKVWRRETSKPGWLIKKWRRNPGSALTRSEEMYIGEKGKDIQRLWLR